MDDFQGMIAHFFSEVAIGKCQIYNEISLQLELGIFLRSAVHPRYMVQYERHVRYFGLNPVSLLKKELDITVFTVDQTERYVFELKYPRAGQYPEQMFKACLDIAFLEQLVVSPTGFDQPWL